MVAQKDAQTTMKDKLVNVAYERLLSQGIEDLSAIGASVACGVSKRTFYKSFASLDEFLDMLLDRVCATVQSEFSAFLSPAVKADAESVQELFIRMPRLMGRHFEQFMVDLRKVRPDLVKKFLFFRRKEFRQVAEKIIAAAGANVARRKLSPRVAADMLQVVVDQLASPQYLVESGETMNTIAHTISQVCLHGLFGKA